MSSDLALLEDDQPRSGLTKSEYRLLSRINQVCIWLATDGEKTTLQNIVEEYELTEIKARELIGKAQDYMSMGILETAEEAKQMYHLRLNEIYNTAAANFVKDEVEITTKAQRLQIVTKDGVETGEYKIVPTQVMKVKKNALNTSAMSVALKALREIAHITGGRPKDVKTAIGNLNLQVNNNGGQLPEAQVLSDLSNEQLAALAGYKHVEVLPEHDIIEAEAQGREDEAGDGGDEEEGRASESRGD